MKEIKFYEGMSDVDYAMYVMYCKHMGQKPLPQNYKFELKGDMANEFNDSQFEDDRSEADFWDMDESFNNF